MGTGHDLVREITQMQISAARYANPLTLLPGNEPINEQVALLLQGGTEFCACYCDQDHFKPFIDVYGYHSGDEVIQLTGKILAEVCDPDRDFIGHIGAVRVEPCKHTSHHKISAAAAEAKKQAKGIPGNSLFIDRRSVCI